MHTSEVYRGRISPYNNAAGTKTLTTIAGPLCHIGLELFINFHYAVGRPPNARSSTMGRSTSKGTLGCYKSAVSLALINSVFIFVSGLAHSTSLVARSECSLTNSKILFLHSAASAKGIDNQSSKSSAKLAVSSPWCKANNLFFCLSCDAFTSGGSLYLRCRSFSSIVKIPAPDLTILRLEPNTPDPRTGNLFVGNRRLSKLSGVNPWSFFSCHQMVFMPIKIGIVNLL